MNPVIAGAIRYNPARVQQFDAGATAILNGDLLKFGTAGVMDPAADNDENLRVFVSLANTAALGLKSQNLGATVVPLEDAVVRIAYTGGTPVVGTSYGISDQRTLDVANTTQLLLTVVNVDTDQGFAECIEYKISA
jgi:hypothetical protein